MKTYPDSSFRALSPNVGASWIVNGTDGRSNASVMAPTGSACPSSTPSSNGISRPNSLADQDWPPLQSRTAFSPPVRSVAASGHLDGSWPQERASGPELGSPRVSVPVSSIGPGSTISGLSPASTLSCTPTAPVNASKEQHPSIREEIPSPSVALDRYAKSFVPKWLKDVNADKNFTFQALHDLEVNKPLNYTRYAMNVWPLPLWESLQTGQIVAGEEQDVGNVEAWLPEGGNGHGDALEAEREETLDDDGSIAVVSQTLDSSQSSASDEQPEDVLAGQFKRTVIPNLPPLTRSSYNLHWFPLLEEEAKHCMEEMPSYNLYAQSFKRYQRESSRTNGLYVVAVPGVREERPRLLPGDRLYLRPLATPPSSYPGQNVGWLHVVFEAQIRAVRTLHGEIVIECPQVDAWCQRGLLNLHLSKFNVIFAYNRRALDAAGYAADLLGQKLYQSGGASSQVLRKWLFPSVEDAQEEVQRVSPSALLSSWHDDGLNPEQKAAVTSIALHERRIPFLLSGPPGTGKTKTCVEAVLQIVRSNKRAKVLLVAPSNAASDVLALRLAKHIPPREMYRINHPTRTFAEVPDALSPYTYVDEQKSVFSLPPWNDLMRARIVVTTCHDVSMLNKSRVASNVDLGELQKRLLPGLSSDPDAPVTLHWTHLLVDEAGQATEPDLAPALWCVLPHPVCRQVPSIVLVGDVKQLGPAIRSDLCRSHELDVSLLERLSRRPAYASSLSSLYKFGRDIVTSRGQGRAPVLADFVNCGHLIRNYRARHPALLHLPSNLFYGDSLVPSSTPTSRSIELLSWRGLPQRGIASGQPLLFVNNDSPDEWTDEGVSWWNQGEASKIVEICQDLLNHNQSLQPEDISVISPFREQVWKVRIMLRRVDLAGVRVGPVEAFQGQESAVVIVSPVRSRKRFIQRDRQTSSGLIFESKRLNVAMTRARELLIVVGNADTLSVCEEWRQIVGHARRNGWIKTWKSNGQLGEDTGDEVEPRTDVSGAGGIDTQRISALEYAEKTGNGWWSMMLAQTGLAENSNGSSYGAAQNGTATVHVNEDEATSLLAGRMATFAMLADDDED